MALARIARAVADLALTRPDGSQHRFRGLSAPIRAERTAQCDPPKRTRQGVPDASAWPATGVVPAGIGGPCPNLPQALPRPFDWQVQITDLMCQSRKMGLSQLFRTGLHGGGGEQGRGRQLDHAKGRRCGQRHQGKPCPQMSGNSPNPKPDRFC
jgi:hypothetical protein